MKFRKIILPTLAVLFLGLGGTLILSQYRPTIVNNSVVADVEQVTERCPFGDAAIEQYSLDCVKAVAKEAEKECGKGKVKVLSNEGYSCKD